MTLLLAFLVVPLLPRTVLLICTIHSCHVALTVGYVLLWLGVIYKLNSVRLCIYPLLLPALDFIIFGVLFPVSGLLLDILLVLIDLAATC